MGVAIKFLITVIEIALGDWVGGSVTAIAIAIALVGAGYALKWHRERVAQGTPGLRQPIFIAIGYVGVALVLLNVVALVIWSRYETLTSRSTDQETVGVKTAHDPADTLKITELTQHLRVAEQRADAAAQGSSGPAPTIEERARKEIVGGPYREADIVRLDQALHSLNDVLVQQSSPAAAKSLDLLHGGDFIPSGGIVAFSETAKAVISEMNSAKDGFDKIVSSNDTYQIEFAEMAQDVDDKTAQATNALLGLARSVDDASKFDVNPGAYMRLLEPQDQTAYAASRDYSDTIKATIANLKTKIDALRKYKP